MKRFTNNIVDIKRGTTDVSKIYRGDIQVWPDEPLCQSPLISQTDLIAYYNFNENFNDFSGNNHNLTNVNNNVTLESDVPFSSFEKSAFFDSNSDNLSNTTYTYPTTLIGFSLNMWFKATSFPTNNNFSNLMSKYFAGTNGGGVELRFFNNNGNLVLDFNIAGSTQGVSNAQYDASGLLLNTWYQISCVYDISDRKAKTYLNGQLVATGSLAVDINNYTAILRPLAIGYANLNNSLVNVRHFRGYIDEFSIFHRSLTLSEIQSLSSSCPLL
jgi:hypothetical protein